MLLTDDKVSHLSHVLLDCLKTTPAARLRGDETQVLRGIKRVLAWELQQGEALDRAVRSRLASYSRQIVEGSPEWEVLYRKALEEERRKRRKP